MITFVAWVDWVELAGLTDLDGFGLVIDDERAILFRVFFLTDDLVEGVAEVFWVFNLVKEVVLAGVIDRLDV